MTHAIDFHVDFWICPNKRHAHLTHVCLTASARPPLQPTSLGKEVANQLSVLVHFLLSVSRVAPSKDGIGFPPDRLIFQCDLHWMHLEDPEARGESMRFMFHGLPAEHVNGLKTRLATDTHTWTTWQSLQPPEKDVPAEDSSHTHPNATKVALLNHTQTRGQQGDHAKA